MSGRICRTALFVDFDNIHIRLDDQEPQAAVEFATNPARWLEWLRQRPPHPEDPETVDRRILVRRCYLNPAMYGRYRPDFIRAAFQVVDCPPLTARGKTSTDIHMVMDVLDALNHTTAFDEFIVLSGDADFTPLLLRLRAHDRRTVVLAVGPASAAYKAACDMLIDQDDFIEQALGIEVAEEPVGAPGVPAVAGPSTDAALLRRIADAVYERASASGKLLASDIPQVYRKFAEFSQGSNWLGFLSLRGMTENVVSAREDLEIVEGDPWRVAVRAATSVADHQNIQIASSTPTASPGDVQDLQELIAAALRAIVAASPAPIPTAKAAQEVIDRLGSVVLSSRWAGTGTFKDLIFQVGSPNLAFVDANGGFIYDPQRHRPPRADSSHDDFQRQEPDLAALARRIHQITDTPYLTAATYRTLFRLISEEVNRAGFNLTLTSKAVRDRCLEEGVQISRASVTFVLRGIIFSGHRFGRERPEVPELLAERFHDNVLSLCDTAQLHLTEEESKAVKRWLVG